MKTTVYPTVSFIIPTLNAADILPKCLAAIRSQKYPKKKIEIIIADGGSTDATIRIAKSYGATIIPNPEVLHEPGKSRASKIARGDIFFFTDADNILASPNWLEYMTRPYRDDPTIMCFLPQTLPARDSNSLDRYMGYLSTDPFTWFVYQMAARPADYTHIYEPIHTAQTYSVFTFTPLQHPLIGLTQGVGANRKFKRGKFGHADDILAIIKLIREGGRIAYVPKAGVYHYHVSGIANFVKKYTWRVRNNIRQDIRGMGLVNRKKFYSIQRKMRMVLFIPYALSIVFPLLDSLFLMRKHRAVVMLWHAPATIILALVIAIESTKAFLVRTSLVAKYE